MENMFYNANQLKYLDVSTFNTEKVKDKSMDNVFIYTGSLSFLNLTSFCLNPGEKNQTVSQKTKYRGGFRERKTINLIENVF